MSPRRTWGHSRPWQYCATHRSSSAGRTKGRRGDQGCRGRRGYGRRCLRAGTGPPRHRGRPGRPERLPAIPAAALSGGQFAAARRGRRPAADHGLRRFAIGHRQTVDRHRPSISPPARWSPTDGSLGAADHLVLAAGSQPNFFGVAGAAEHAFPLYSVTDAERLRLHLKEQLRLHCYPDGADPGTAECRHRRRRLHRGRGGRRHRRAVRPAVRRRPAARQGHCAPGRPRQGRARARSPRSPTSTRCASSPSTACRSPSVLPSPR